MSESAILCLGRNLTTSTTLRLRFESSQLTLHLTPFQFHAVFKFKSAFKVIQP